MAAKRNYLRRWRYWLQKQRDMLFERLTLIEGCRYCRSYCLIETPRSSKMREMNIECAILARNLDESTLMPEASFNLDYLLS